MVKSTPALRFPRSRFSMIKRTMIPWVLIVSGFCSSALSSPEYHFVNFPKNYTEAKTFCREMYTDLATVGNSSDEVKWISSVPAKLPRAWIGLELGDVRTWHWSSPGEEVDFVNWEEGEPQDGDTDGCGAMNPGGKWFESDCNTQRRFVCEGSNETAGRTFIDATKSWREAQDHCRALSGDLVSVRSAEDNGAVQNASRSQSVWIGLFEDPWAWSDGSGSPFRFWRSGQPNYQKTDQRCVVAVFRDKGRWNDLGCNTDHKFVCQGAAKSVPTPAPTTINTTWSEGVSATTTAHAFTANATTKSPTTGSAQHQSAASTFEPTTPTFAAPVSSPDPSTELSNETAENETTTGIPSPPQTATVQMTANNTSSYNATPPTTTVSSSNTTESPPTGPTSDNLILIRVNMSWNEALLYCREHHVSLVSVTNPEIQEQVAMATEKATSPYAWLGLRYTCSFDFWFWTGSDRGQCYHNWAPGHGPEGQNDCGVAGAVEATGGRQWVGLPEINKLNFICQTCGNT